MKIIIVGAGKVGFFLAEQLSREQHDVTVIDSSEESLRRVADALDVMSFKGNGVTADVLRQAGAEQADILVAATDRDEVNMVCCLSARKMGCRYTIARIRNPEYFSNLSAFKRDMGISMVINPERATAREIARLLRFPSAANIESFCRGRVELMSFRVQKDDFITGKPLFSLSGQLQKLSMLFCAAEREGEVIIPNGAFVPQPDDKLYIIGQSAGVDQFFRLLGRYSHKAKNVMLIGGGRITIYLAELLEQMHMRVKIVERSEERCRALSEQLPKTMVICGDGTDQEVLDSESLTSSDAFVALTDRDEDNLIISLYAMQQGLGKVIVKSNRQNYAGIARAVGLDSVISPKLITAAHILHVVRGMQNSQGSVMHALYRIADDQAEATEFSVNKNTQYLGVPLKDLRLKKGILVAVIVREDTVIIPDGSACILEGDSVIIVSREHTVLDVNDIFDTSF
ncbi:MAG: Trk system potassium transporter TrkA [Oscillospiraceae bacterium]|nr:Trk system potassium transporter TrkA [Oscillospiraceae bacterium]